MLAGGIAHDFNNLLTGIMGNASIVLDDLPPENPVRENLEAVMKASERAAALTRQLLAYAGKGRFVIEPLNLSELAREITSLLQTSIPRTVELRLQLQDDLPSIEGDAAQIQQLIMNLVINAAEAVEEGQTETVWIITRLEQVSQAAYQPDDFPEWRRAGQIRHAGGARCRLRNGRRDAVAHFRPVLHHQIYGPGTRSGRGDGHGARTQRRAACGEHSGKRKLL